MLLATQAIIELGNGLDSLVILCAVYSLFYLSSSVDRYSASFGLSIMERSLPPPALGVGNIVFHPLEWLSISDLMLPCIATCFRCFQSYTITLLVPTSLSSRLQFWTIAQTLVQMTIRPFFNKTNVLEHSIILC